MNDARANDSARPLMVARRWDQLGGRLTAMVNAAAGAEVHGGTFGFVWPRVREAHLEDPSMLFTDEFLAQHELTEADLADRTPVWFGDVVPLRTDALRGRVNAQPRGFVEVAEAFSVVRWMYEEPVPAASRFRSAFARFGWNEDVRAIIDASRDWLHGGPRNAVHVRAGDIINGDWDLFLAHAKYSPTPLVHEAIRQLSAQGEVLVVSDNPAYLRWLVARFPSVITARDLVPGYDEMPDIHRAFADLVLLSRCATVVAPPSSAFSMFASMIGEATIVRSDELCDEGSARELMARGVAVAVREAKSSHSWATLASRDIAWQLDVFGRNWRARKRWSMARKAVDLDPRFAGALNRLARASAERGRWDEAAHAADRAVTISESADHRDDPLFESLVTRLLVACLEALVRRRPLDGQFADELLARADDLTPHMMPKWRVLAVVRALASAATVPVERAPVAEPARVPSAWSLHVAAGHYDALTPEVERLAWRAGVYT